MQYTDNYELKKPEPDDFYNVDDFNYNTEKIDIELKNHAEQISKASTVADGLTSVIGSGELQTTEQTIISAVNEVAEIAKGKNRARVFATTESMNAWLSDSGNSGVAIVGDNLYIVDVGVPDWWIEEVLEEPDADGRYYKIAQLETQKVDLTTYDKRIQQNEEDISALNSDLAKKSNTGHTHSISDVTNLQSNLNTLSNRGNYTELGRYYSAVGNEAGTISADLSVYRYLVFNFIFDNEIIDSKILPRQLFTDYCSAYPIKLTFGSYQAQVRHNSGIYVFVNSAYYVVAAYGVK